MKTLERCQWLRSIVYIVTCEHFSTFLSIIDFEEAKVCWVYIEKINTFNTRSGIFKCDQNLLPNSIWNYNPKGESVKNFSEGVYFSRQF